MPDTIPTPPGTNSFDTVSVDAQPTVIQDFKLNHPKNYLAVPVAEAIDESTDFLIREYAVNLPDRARRGAEETGLIQENSSLTSLGEAVVATATRVHGSPKEALEAFGELHGSPKRFVDVLPEWEGMARRVAFQYDPTAHLVSFLREQGELQLDTLTWLLWKHDPSLAEAVFLHPRISESQSVTTATRPPRDIFQDSSVYRSESTFQYKAFLYHCGILNSRGDYTSRLNPTTDTWTIYKSIE